MKLCHPLNDCPSKSSFHPAAFSAAVNRFASELSGAAAAPRCSEKTISKAATGLDAKAAFDFMRLFFRNLRKGKAESIRIQSSEFPASTSFRRGRAEAPERRRKSSKFPASPLRCLSYLLFKSPLRSKFKVQSLAPNRPRRRPRPRLVPLFKDCQSRNPGDMDLKETTEETKREGREF